MIMLSETGALSSGARGLLVAMICYAVRDMDSLTIGIPMNLSQIRDTFRTMLDMKYFRGGILIGHECLDSSISAWTFELSCTGVLKGGAGFLNRGQITQVREIMDDNLYQQFSSRRSE